MTFKYHDFSFRFRFSALGSRCAEISQQLNHVHALCPGTGKYSRRSEYGRIQKKLQNRFLSPTIVARFVLISRSYIPNMIQFAPLGIVSQHLFLLIKSVHFYHRQRHRKNLQRTFSLLNFASAPPIMGRNENP